MRIASISLICCVIVFLGINIAINRYIQQQDTAIRAAAFAQPNDQSNSQQLAPPVELLEALQVPGRFQLRYKISDIPIPVQGSFAKQAQEDSFLMAEPGARWNPGCVLVPGLPRHRLVSVAICDSLCLVFYEQGGFAPTSKVEVFRTTGNVTESIWRANLGSKVKDPVGLAAAVKARDFF